MDQPSRIIKPGTVSERVQQINSVTIGIPINPSRRHNSFPLSDVHDLDYDYRSCLYHVEPRSVSLENSHFYIPKLQHINRAGVEHRECPPISTSDPGVEVMPETLDIQTPEPLHRPIEISEIQSRMRKRPYLQHICGHYEQGVTISVPGDNSKQFLIEEGAPGSFIIVGPQLQSTTLGPRLQVLMEDGKPFIIPFPCMACKAQSRHPSANSEPSPSGQQCRRISNDSQTTAYSSTSSSSSFNTIQTPLRYESKIPLPTIQRRRPKSPSKQLPCTASRHNIQRRELIIPAAFTGPVTSPGVSTPFPSGSPIKKLAPGLHNVSSSELLLSSSPSSSSAA
jgi:hypothetical protein